MDAPSSRDRPRLLFLCQSLPFPPDGGLHLRSYNILRLLAAEFDVEALFFYRRATRPTAEHVTRGLDGLSRLGPARAFPIPQEERRSRLLLDHATSVATRTVYTRHLYRSNAFANALQDALDRFRPHIAHVDSLDLSAYLPALRGIPTVVTHHNVESLLLRRRAEGESSPLRRRYLRFQARLMEREERAWSPRVALNVVVSPSEEAALRRISPSARTCVVPNGVDTSVFTPRAGAGGRGLVFVGSHSWFPNRDAMEYFTREILPLVRARAGQVPVDWVGRASPEIVSAYEREHGVHLTGYVEDIQPHVHGAACYVVPLRVGGGTRLKILDAWAMGSPIVSTSIGCEGLDARDGSNMLIRDDPEEFAEAVIRVLADPELAGELGRAGRRTAETVYDWEVIGDAMLPRYRELPGSEG